VAVTRGVAEVELVQDGSLPTDGSLLVGAPDATAHVNVVEARSPRDGRLLWQRDLRSVVVPSGLGSVAGVAPSTGVGRIVAFRADWSAEVLG
jgi:hypothetical protein